MRKLWNFQRFGDSSELENNVKTARIERGWTQKELARVLGVSVRTVCAVELGYVGPLDKKGNFKPWTKKIENALGPIEDLFPREVCALAKNEFTVSQVQDMVGCTLQTVDDLLEREVARVLLQRLPIRFQRIVVRYVCFEQTPEEIGAEENISSVRVRQIVQKSLRMMRHPSSVRATGLTISDLISS